MTRILLINGSPRGGHSNSIKIAKEFIAGAFPDKNSSAVIDELNIYDMDIKPCSGCFGCWKRGEGDCLLAKDDMQQAYTAIDQADMIIAAFPMYYFGIPSEMKRFIDKLLPVTLPYDVTSSDTAKRWRNQTWYEKKLVIISTCGYAAISPAFDGLKAQLDLIFGKDNYTGIFCPQAELFRADRAKPYTDRYLSRIKEGGREFFESGEITPETYSLINKQIMSEKAFALMASHWVDARDDIKG